MDLLPDQLASLWRDVEQHRLSTEEYVAKEQLLLNEYVDTWEKALITPGRKTLEESLLCELAAYYNQGDLDQVREQWLDTRSKIAEAWRKEVNPDDKCSIDSFYDTCEVDLYIHALMYWHSLKEDNSPLAYVTALRFAQMHGCRTYLDFGAGVGSGGLLFASNGLKTTLADISSPMLEFSRWRFERRRTTAECIDLKVAKLPDDSYDFISAMDVFEHLSDPIGTVEALAKALKPNGFLYGRFAMQEDDEHPLHIVHDFSPVFSRLEQLGFKEVWKDRWNWGHQVFQKPGSSAEFAGLSGRNTVC